MFYMLFILFFILAILFMLLGYYFVEKENLILATMFTLLTTVLWFMLAAAVIELEFPYTAIQTDNTIVNGTHTWGDSTAVSMMYFFIMMAGIEIVYGLGTIPKLLFKIWKEWKDERLMSWEKR